MSLFMGFFFPEEYEMMTCNWKKLTFCTVQSLKKSTLKRKQIKLQCLNHFVLFNFIFEFRGDSVFNPDLLPSIRTKQSNFCLFECE